MKRAIVVVPDAATLRRLSAAHGGVDPRTILRCLSGAKIHGLAARERAEAAAAEWRASQAPAKAPKRRARKS